MARPVELAKRPARGDELIAELFESMHDLHFLLAPQEGAEFVLALSLEKFRSKAGIVQLYDINHREFVIVRAVGPKAQLVLGGRTAERDPLVNEIMKRRGPFALDVTKDPRVRAGRWAAIGAAPKVILASRVAQGGRFLGLIEITNPADGSYDQSEINGLGYVAEHFADFVASCGLVFSSATSMPPTK